MAGLFMLCIYGIAKIDPAKAPRGEPTSFREKIVSLKGIVSMLVLILIILGECSKGVCSALPKGVPSAP